MKELELTLLSYLVNGLVNRPLRWREVFAALDAEVPGPMSVEFLAAVSTIKKAFEKHFAAVVETAEVGRHLNLVDEELASCGGAISTAFSWALNNKES